MRRFPMPSILLAAALIPSRPSTPSEPHRIPLLLAINWERYAGDGYVMAREFGDFSKEDSHLSGDWVLRKDGEQIGYSPYRHELAERHGVKLEIRPNPTW